MNIGALNDNSTFALTGSVDGVNAMTGGGEVSASVKGSYKQTSKSKSFESHTYPSAPNTAEKNEIGIIYQFASFNGKTIMPTWIGPIQEFGIAFDNANGGTYIGECKVEYSVPGSTDRMVREVSVSGGLVRSINGIPLDAYDLKISIHFKGGDDFQFSFPSPTASWLTGQATVDMSGVWPWKSEAKVREAWSR